MGKWSRRVLGAILCLIGTATTGLAADKVDQGTQPAPDRNWQVGFNPSYSSGNYGTNTTSTFLYAPLSIRRLFRDGDVTLVIPFVTATTSGGATLVGGQPTQTIPDSCFSNSGQGNPENRPECQGLFTGGSAGGAASQKVTNSGLGDIILRGRYYFVEEKDYLPLIAMTARMKIPTADNTRGLGTGAFDHGYGVEMSKRLGDDWLGFLDGGYNFIGDPDGRNLRNQYWYDVGVGYYITRSILASVYFEEYRSLVSSVVNIRDFFFGANYSASAAWRFNAGVTVGVSSAAPDHVVSLGTSYRF